jgi:hypothetical protein
MNEDQFEALRIDSYRAGYWECRNVISYQLRKMLEAGDASPSGVADFIEELENNRRKEAWELIQEEHPGITEDRYEADLKADCETIKNTYYSRHGFLKPRLVRD